MNAINALLETDFGSIDGLYDEHLDKYFLDKNYWGDIINQDNFFVIGRKGAGKSAIYNWIQGQAEEKGAIISNLSFTDFPC